MLAAEVAMDMKAGATDSSKAADFTVVCHRCGSLSICYDANLSETIVRCGACNSPRCTLAALQVLANSNRRDLLDA